MIIIKNIDVYSPEYIGKKDIFIAGEKIQIIEEKIEWQNGNIKIIDGINKKLVPGFIDNHVHITGGGGEGSFKTRVPEITLSKLISGGITTVVGLLGTDSITRSVENLVAKAKALKEEGLTVFVHTGSYGYPSITLTGSIKKDIVFIEEVIGLKIALSDHRSPSVNRDELARIASDVRVAGMLSGKAGFIVAHMGSGEKKLDLIREVLKETEIPIRIIRPTHVNRTKELLMDALEYAKEGGIIDLTCGIETNLSPYSIIKMAKEKNLPEDSIIISSDGYGSFSSYDEHGNLTKIGVASVSSLFEEFKKMIEIANMEIADALIYFTKNVAKSLNVYPKKGAISVGSDADLLILDNELNIDSVIARGKVFMENKEIIVKGTYE